MAAPTFKTRPMQALEHRLGRPLDEVLRDLYHGQGKTLDEVATELGVTLGTISRWMDALGVERRFPGQKGKAAA